MKRPVIVSLSALTFSLIAFPALANDVSTFKPTSIRSIVEITPFNLVTRSYQGYFAEQGIPSNAAFVNAVRRGTVTAEDLVNKAIAKGRLSPETINDQAYLNHVGSHLAHLDEN